MSMSKIERLRKLLYSELDKVVTTLEIQAREIGNQELVRQEKRFQKHIKVLEKAGYNVSLGYHEKWKIIDNAPGAVRIRKRIAEIKKSVADSFRQMELAYLFPSERATKIENLFNQAIVTIRAAAKEAEGS